MKHRCLAAIAILLMLPFAALAGVVKGKVTDDKGEPLPYATVYVQGTTMGTTTNNDAEYRLQLQPGTYWVVCQYMGFSQSSFNVTIKGNEEVTHNFSLKEQTLEMNAVTIKANSEDPAYGIMRKVIARRSFHLSQVKSFQSAIYLKGIFRNRAMPKKIGGVMKEKDGNQFKAEMGLDSTGKGILYLVEQDADYYAEGGKEKTIIHSVRESGNPNGNGLSRMPPVVSFYENNVNVMSGAAPRGFISPVSDNAIMYYKFKYEGEFRENGYTIDKIKVTPRRLYEPLFEGTIYIVEDDWAIHSLSLLATKTANLQTLDTLFVEQTFLPLRKDTWVIKNQVIYPTLNLMGFNVSGRFVTVYDRQKVNEPVPDSIFTGNVVSKYDADANKKDTSYFTTARPIPLQEDESNDYVVKDSLREKYESPEYIDSMRRVGNKFSPSDLFVSGVHYDTRKYKNTFRTNAILATNNPLVSFNTVEGLVIAPKVWWTSEIDSYRAINTIISGRYGFSNERFNAIARTTYRQDDKNWIGRWWEVGVEGGRYVHQFNPLSNMNPLYNTVSTLLYAQNYMKLYERWTGAAFFEKNHGNGLRWNVRLGYQDRSLLSNTTSYTWSEHKERLTANVPGYTQPVLFADNKAVLAKASISYKPGYTYTLYPDYKRPNGSRWPTFTLSYEKGIPDILNSVSDFDKWRFGVEDNLRMKLLGELAYNIAAGGFLNDKAVHAQDLMYMTDNQVFAAAPYVRSFQNMPYYSFANTADLYAEAHVEYMLKGLLTNKIPLFRKAQWYLVVGNNTFYVNDNNYHTEVFVGADNIGYKFARLLRVDVVQSWNSLNLPTTSVRIGIKPGGLMRINATRNDKTDW
jgi:hypothetical protein